MTTTFTDIITRAAQTDEPYYHHLSRAELLAHLHTKKIVSQDTVHQTAIPLCDSPDNIDTCIKDFLTRNQIGVNLLTSALVHPHTKDHNDWYLTQGKDAFTTVRHAILHSNETLMYVLIDFDQFMRVFDSQQERIALTKARQQKNIYSKTIFSSMAPQVVDPGTYLPEDFLWVHNQRLYFGMDVNLLGDTIMFSNLNDREPWAVVTQHAPIARTLQFMYQHLWVALNR